MCKILLKGISKLYFNFALIIISESFYIEKDKVSLILPSRFQEKFIRVYAKDKKKLNTIKVAFKKYCKK